MKTNVDMPNRPVVRGFTLVELLISVSVVALLVSILLPSLRTARDQAKAAYCGSNIRQILIANQLYAGDNTGRACPGAADFLSNLNRWHGARIRASDPFDSAAGPLAPYMGASPGIRSCPSFRGFDAQSGSAFELGTGGYGYNNAFIGVELRALSAGFFAIETDRTGVQMTRVRTPAATVMFADAALVTSGLIEYSFVEPRFFPTNGYRPDPSIHFRHDLNANVGWCDGHVDRRRLSFSTSSGIYPQRPDRFDVGWFGQRDDNRFFDLD
jgi:prepilin-type N-terminal cleavage/methylation domain-containing protein/prepilin-type processing-associated H-X9-DG protein